MLLDDLLAQTRLVTLRYGERELNIEYYRQKLFDAEGQRISLSLQAPQPTLSAQAELVATFLAHVLAWWDLYHSEGTPLPINTETLKTLPMNVLNDVALAILANETKPSLLSQ